MTASVDSRTSPIGNTRGSHAWCEQNTGANEPKFPAENQLCSFGDLGYFVTPSEKHLLVSYITAGGRVAGDIPGTWTGRPDPA